MNRQRFDDAAAQFRAVAPRYNEFAFLLILSHVTLVSKTPAIRIVADEFKAYLKAQFGIGDAQTIKVLTKVLRPELFDFPVVVPEIEAVEVKGTFTLVSDSDRRSASHSLHFTVSRLNTRSRERMRRWNWLPRTSTGARHHSPQTIPFRFRLARSSPI